MNYKLEKFWNEGKVGNAAIGEIMNYKLEKFWNKLFSSISALLRFYEL